MYIYIYIYKTHFHFPFFYQWTFMLLPYLGCCKQCCNERWGACIFFKLWFSLDKWPLMGFLGHMATLFLLFKGSPPTWLSGKGTMCQCRRRKRCGFESCVQKSLWRRKWQSFPVFLLERSRGQRSLEGYSPWGHKELDTTERLSVHALTYYFLEWL